MNFLRYVHSCFLHRYCITKNKNTMGIKSLICNTWNKNKQDVHFSNVKTLQVYYFPTQDELCVQSFIFKDQGVLVYYAEIFQDYVSIVFLSKDFVVIYFIQPKCLKDINQSFTQSNYHMSTTSHFYYNFLIKTIKNYLCVCVFLRFLLKK